MAERNTALAAHSTIRSESAYGTGDGTVSDEYPILEGGDGLVDVKEVTVRRGVSGRGPLGHRVSKQHAAGPITYDFDYDQMARQLKACLGQAETDSQASPLTGLHENYFYQTDQLASYTISVFRDDTKFTYGGCVCPSWTLRYSGDDDILQLEMEWVGRTGATASNASEPTYPTWKVVQRSHLTAFTVGSYNMSAKVKSFEVTGTNPVDTDRWLAGASSLGQPLINGQRTVTMSMELEWIDEVFNQGSTDAGMLVDWAAGTPRIVTMTWNNGDTSPATDEREFGLYIPAAYVTGNPISIESQGTINASIALTATDADIAADALGKIGTGENAARTKQLINFWLSNAEDGNSL